MKHLYLRISHAQKINIQLNPKKKIVQCLLSICISIMLKLISYTQKINEQLNPEGKEYNVSSAYAYVLC